MIGRNKTSLHGNRHGLLREQSRSCAISQTPCTIVFLSKNAFTFLYLSLTVLLLKDTCNETENPARALPCYATTGRECYSRAERCDGVNQCVNWADEADCPETNENSTIPILHQLGSYEMLYRNWEDGAWMWRSTLVKYDFSLDSFT